jgi:WD40 repeat protein
MPPSGNDQACGGVGVKPSATVVAALGVCAAVGGLAVWWATRSRDPVPPPEPDTLTLRGHTSTVHALAFSPDGKTLASGSYDHTVRLWDTSTWKTTRSLAERAAVLSVAFSPDGRTLASCGPDDTVRLWDSVTGRETASLTGSACCVTELAFSPDGTTIASRSEGRIRLWDVPTRRNTVTFGGLTEYVARLAFSPDGRVIASGG